VLRAIAARSPDVLAPSIEPAPACNWQDIGDTTPNQVIARGGDVVVVTFAD
jgi:hypothetical protein